MKIDAAAKEVPLRKCEHCNSMYSFYKSTSRYLKFTYCGMLCEVAALGFSIEAALLMTRKGAVSESAVAEEKKEITIAPFELSHAVDGDEKVLVG